MCHQFRGRLPLPPPHTCHTPLRNLLYCTLLFCHHNKNASEMQRQQTNWIYFLTLSSSPVVVCQSAKQNHLNIYSAVTLQQISRSNYHHRLCLWNFKLTQRNSYLCIHTKQCTTTVANKQTKTELEMWASAQRDGRPAEYRCRPLFNAAKFGWRPLLDAVQ